MSVSVEPWRGGFRDGVASCASRSRWKSRTASLVAPAAERLGVGWRRSRDLAAAVGMDIVSRARRVRSSGAALRGSRGLFGRVAASDLAERLASAWDRLLAVGRVAAVVAAAMDLD